ncbi:hypothetical protein BaRGS_00037609, partial [Batillaria attramentaria]
KVGPPPVASWDFLIWQSPPSGGGRHLWVSDSCQICRVLRVRQKLILSFTWGIDSWGELQTGKY